MRLVVASGNENKLREIREIMEGLTAEVISMKALGLRAEAEENGKSFQENAEIKAREIYEKLCARDGKDALSDTVVIADDSGLCVDFLEGAPGIYSARFMGYDTPYEEKRQAIMDALSDAKETERGAQFVAAICALLPDGKALFAEGVLAGEIAKKEAGENGFGYDAIFYLPEYGKTTAELSAEEKNRISHRGLALKELRKKLFQQNMGNNRGR